MKRMEGTVETLRVNGITTDHCGRQVARSDFEEFDYILAMDVGSPRPAVTIMGGCGA